MGKTPAYGTKGDLIAYILSPEGLAAKLSDAGPTPTEARKWTL